MQEVVYIPIENTYIPGILQLPNIDKKHPLVLMIHGMLSCKSGDGRLFPIIADALEKVGIATLRIDSCSCGESRRSRKLYKPTTLIEEAKVAFEYIKKDSRIDDTRIAIMGHSLGGLVAFNCAGLKPKCLITLNGAMNKKRTEEYQLIDQYKIDDEGDKYIMQKQSDGRIELLYEDFYKDVATFPNRYEYEGNYLMCVATNDPHITMDTNYEFFENLNTQNKKMIVIEDANHTFNAKTGDYTKLNELISKMLPWIEENL